MRGADVRRNVLAAVERGELPRGGPSELAARDLTADVPAGYWDRWSSGAAQRIRAEVAAQACRCELPAPVEDGRCSRCYGLRPVLQEDADRRALLRALPPGADQ